MGGYEGIGLIVDDHVLSYHSRWWLRFWRDLADKQGRRLEAMMKMDTDKMVMLKLRGFKVTEPRPLPVTPMVTLHSCPGATVEILDAEAAVPPKVEPDRTLFATSFSALIGEQGHVSLIGTVAGVEPLSTTTRGNPRCDGLLIDAAGFEISLSAIGSNAIEMAEIPVKSMVLLFGAQLIQALGRGVAVGRNCQARGRSNKTFKMG